MDVLGLLTAKGIEYEHKGGAEYAIICPNQHNHSGGVDAKPSFNINVDKLKGHCFSCSLSMAQEGLTKWLMGEDLDELQTASLSLRGKLKRIAEHVSEDISCLVLNEGEFTMVPPSTPFREEYRNISAGTYELLDARHCKVGRYADRIFFKIEMHGRLLGIDARALKSDMQPKYLRPKGAKAAEWLYPYDHARRANIKRVILCEGIFDAINFYDKMGIPEALAVFGVNNFGADNVLDIIGLGVEEVILLPDNDKAGHEAKHKWAGMLKDWVPVYVAALDHLVDGKDLGNAKKDSIEFSLQNKTPYRG